MITPRSKESTSFLIPSTSSKTKRKELRTNWRFMIRNLLEGSREHPIGRRRNLWEIYICIIRDLSSILIRGKRLKANKRVWVAVHQSQVNQIKVEAQANIQQVLMIRAHHRQTLINPKIRISCIRFRHHQINNKKHLETQVKVLAAAIPWVELLIQMLAS